MQISWYQATASRVGACGMAHQTAVGVQQMVSAVVCSTDVMLYSNVGAFRYCVYVYSGIALDLSLIVSLSLAYTLVCY